MELGIDIGARQHEVMLLDGGSEDGFSITNDARGNKALLKAIGGRPCRAVLEATGAYYLDTAIALFDAGVEVMVINPRHGKHFAKALGWHSSTDRISARMLAEFAQRMPFKAWTPPPGTWMEFRGISRQINRLTKLLAASKNRLHAHQATAQSSRVILDDERYGIELYEQRIARLTAAAMQLIDQDEELNRLHRQFTAAKGIADVSAIAIIGELITLPRSMNSKQCTKHAGLDVVLKESGDSVRGQSRISKCGNAYLRGALFMPALVAIQHEPRVRARYEALLNRGKTGRQAQCAIMRKYLTGLWAVLKNNEPFDSAKLFPDPQIA